MKFNFIRDFGEIDYESFNCIQLFIADLHKQSAPGEFDLVEGNCYFMLMYTSIVLK